MIGASMVNVPSVRLPLAPLSKLPTRIASTGSREPLLPFGNRVRIVRQTVLRCCVPEVVVLDELDLHCIGLGGQQLRPIRFDEVVCLCVRRCVQDVFGELCLVLGT